MGEHEADKQRRLFEGQLLREALDKDRMAERQKIAARAAITRDVYDTNRKNYIEKQRQLRQSLESDRNENERNENIRRLSIERMQFEQKMKNDWLDRVNWSNRALAEEIKLRNLEKDLEERRRVVNDAQLPDAHVFNGTDHYVKVMGSNPSKTNAYRQGKNEFERNEEDYKRNMEAFYRNDIQAMQGQKRQYNSDLVDNRSEARKEDFMSRRANIVDKLILNQYHIKHGLEKGRKQFEDIVLNRNISTINKSGIYDSYKELEPKYDWDFGNSSYVGKKDFSAKRENYKLFE